jgi:hypothetical protein
MHKKADQTTLRLTLVYLLGLTLLATGWWVGFLGPVVASSGWVGKIVFGLVLAHMGLAFYTAHTAAFRKPYILLSDLQDLHPADGSKLIKLRSEHRKGESLVSWLDKLDSSILALGFLGKLYAIAKILSAVSGTDAASIATGLKAVSNGVSVALFSTMLGLGLSLWTHCATIVVSNRLNSLRE